MSESVVQIQNTSDRPYIGRVDSREFYFEPGQTKIVRTEFAMHMASHGKWARIGKKGKINGVGGAPLKVISQPLDFNKLLNSLTESDANLKALMEGGKIAVDLEGARPMAQGQQLGDRMDAIADPSAGIGDSIPVVHAD